MNRKWQWRGARRYGARRPNHLLLLLLILTSLAATAAAAPAEKVAVLIAFAHQPGAADEALVEGVGGEIDHRYRLVPALAARVPAPAIAALNENPQVTAVEPDIEAHLIDAELDNAWGVKRVGAGIVHAEGNQGAGIKVGIIDSGIDRDHPDLAYDPDCSANFVAGESLDDGNSHGTHVAGTVAALNDDVGVVGVAPAATLCIYKVFDSAGNASYSDIVAALEQAAGDGVQVTNSSFGSAADPGTIVKAAYDNAYAAGMLHVAAAGNYGDLLGTGDNCIYPARWQTVLATSATTQNDTRALYSSTCPEVALAAPGDLIYSTLPGGGYGTKSGTSMAAPHAAGAAALVLAANPGWTNAEVSARLQETARDLGDTGRDTWYGYGLVDAAAATGTADPQVHVGDLDGAVTSANKKFWWAAVTVTVHDQDESLVAGASVRGTWSGGDGGTGSCQTGSEGTCILSSPKLSRANGAVTFAVDDVTVTTSSYEPTANHDADGDSDGSSIVVSRGGNQAPSAQFTYMCSDLTCSVDASASSDADGNIVSYAWNFGDGASATGVTSSHTYPTAGIYTIRLTATDDDGATGTADQSIAVGTAAGTMFVSDLAITGRRAGPNRTATVVVTIYDTDGSPVGGATVYGTWSGASSSSASGVTAEDGTVSLTSDRSRQANAAFTFTVDNVVHPDFTYDPGLNSESQVSIIVP